MAANTPEVNAPQIKDQLQAKVEEIRRLLMEVAEIVSEMSQKTADRTQPLLARVAELEQEVKALSNSHWDTLTRGKSKTVNLGHDQKVYKQKSTEVAYDRDKNEILAELRKKPSWRRFWNRKVSYSINETAVKKWQWITQRIHGLRVVEYDKFWIQTGKNEKGEAVTRQVN